MLKVKSSRQEKRPGTNGLEQGDAPRSLEKFACKPLDCENRLDEVFERHQNHVAELSCPTQPPRQISPMDMLRKLFVNDLIPVVNELREKYSSKGLSLQMNAERFLDGKREVVIEMQFEGIGMRYNGTVIDGVIAFSQTRFDDEDRSGLTASGAALRTRGLNAERFRAFLCDRIAHLVQQASKRRR
ncbi:MAG: hypothetical protein DHS20C16_10780 [Phycisphaerae bacterium]|nr:MAG: hypothetical protein DHS20C16_10780 [Phycisphaerae bacterium]